MNLKNLKQRGGTWSVVYNVPKALRERHKRPDGSYALPREIVRALGTADRKEAMSLKHAALLEIQAELHRITKGDREDTFSLMAEARGLARDRSGMDPYGRAIDGLDLQIIDRAESIAERDGTSSRAHRFAGVALGRAIPISEAAQEWRAEWRGIAGRTRDKYERVLENFQDHSGDCAIHSITRRNGIEYLKHLKETPSKRTGKPRSDKSIKDDIITLASFYKACIRLGLLPLTHENPFEKILGRLPGQKDDNEGEGDKLKAVTREKAEKLLAACDNAKRKEMGLKPLARSYEMMAIIRLLWVTGARANEIASLTRDRIEDEGDLIWLRIADAKTRAGNRWLCLVGEPERELVRETLQEADKALAEVDGAGNPVVPEENRQLLFPRLRRGGADRQPYWMIQKAFGSVRKATFGENLDWNMHSFRRRAVTAMDEAQIPEQDQNLVVGHSNSKFFGIHTYADAERRKTAERTMRKLYEELGGSLNG